MMRRTAHNPNGSLPDRVAPLIVLVLMMMITGAEAGVTNQINDVRIAEVKGKTEVSIVGSSKPEFTAFKLSSPSRLVIDVAGSKIRGVPSFIDTRAGLLTGVAVSEFSVNGVPVSRIMIGFKNDAAYRVRIKGSTLVATLAGSLSAFKNSGDAKAAEPVSADARVKMEKAEREIAALKEESKKNFESYKAAEAEAERTAGELKAVTVSAAAAKRDAEQARAKLLETKKAAAAAEKKAAAASRELALLKKEAAKTRRQAESRMSRTSASQTKTREEAEAIRAELARVEARLAKADLEAKNYRKELVKWQEEASLAKKRAERADQDLKALKRDAAAAKKEALSAKEEALRAKKEASSAKSEAKKARVEQARSAEDAKRANAQAEEAKKRLETLRAKAESAKSAAAAAKNEIVSSKLSAEQAMNRAEAVKAELLALKKEAAAAKERAMRAEKNLNAYRDVEGADRRDSSKHRQALTQAKQQAARLSAQATAAEAVAKKERGERRALEEKTARLQKELSALRAANRSMETSRRRAEEKAHALETKLTSMKSDLRSAQKAASVAATAQTKAAKAYKQAAKAEQENLLAILREKEKQSVKAKQRAEAIRREKDATEKALVSAQWSLRDAAVQARLKEEKRLKADRALQAANAEAEQAALSLRDWEKKAAVARAEAARMEKEIIAVKQKARAESLRIQKSGDKKVAAARAELLSAEKAEQAALKKLSSAEETLRRHLEDAEKASARAALLEAKLAKASRTISAKEAKIEKLTAEKARSDNAAKEARRALAQAETEVLAAEQKAEKTIAESKKAVAEAEKRWRLAAEAKASVSSAAVSPGKEELRPESQEGRRMTQEEIRLARLRELRGEKASTMQKQSSSPPVSASPPVKKTGSVSSPVISAVEFQSDEDSQRIIIKSSRPLKYAVNKDSMGNASLSFENAKLAPLLERTLDVTDFEGIIGSISSYQKKGRAIVEVGVERAALSSVNEDNDKIEIVFRDKGYGPTDVLTSMPAAPLGTASKTVAVEAGETYAHLHDRTAASGMSRKSGRKKKYTGRHVDLDFKDADIHNILRLLSDVGHVNIITGDDVRGSVTIRMRDVAWDHALDIILQAKQLGMVREGNLIRVAPMAVLEKEREMEIARRKQHIALEPLETRLIPISYAKAAELMPRAQDLLSDRGKLSVDARTNVIIARDTKGILNQVEALIRNLDTQTPQVLIESRIVEATSTYAREIGIQWGGDFTASSATGNPTGLAFPSSIGIAGGATDSSTPTSGLTTSSSGQANPNFGVNLPAAVGTNAGGALGITLGSIANNANLSLRLSALEETGTVRILSSPKILTLDNREAHIEQGTLIPYSQVSAQGVQTAFKEAKLNLTVTPHVTADGSVLLNMHMTRDEPDFSNTGASGDPTILKREAQTELLVSDGHTAVIGGIFTRNAGTSYKKVPFFADIPIIGWLFKKKTDSDKRSEMLIFITPRIVNRAESIGR